MSKKFYLTSEEDCQKCEGSGEVYNEAWNELNAQWSKIEGALHASGKSREEFFEDIDLPDGKAFQREHGAEFLPCSDCEGAGKIVRRIELAEALEAIGLDVPYLTSEYTQVGQGFVMSNLTPS